MDPLLRELLRETKVDFRGLTLAAWDELNIIQLKVALNRMYSKMAKRAERMYIRIAEQERDDLLDDLVELELIKDPGAYRKRIDVTKWVSDQLSKPNPVTQYFFWPEVDRKRMRLQEAILTGKHFADKGMVDKAIHTGLRLFSQQLEQFGIDITENIRQEVFEQTSEFDPEDIQWVWVTQHDSKVCEECASREGMVVSMSRLPTRHYYCRCYLLPLTVYRRIMGIP